MNKIRGLSLRHRWKNEDMLGHWSSGGRTFTCFRVEKAFTYC